MSFHVPYRVSLCSANFTYFFSLAVKARFHWWRTNWLFYYELTLKNNNWTWKMQKKCLLNRREIKVCKYASTLPENALKGWEIYPYTWNEMIPKVTIKEGLASITLNKAVNIKQLCLFRTDNIFCKKILWVIRSSCVRKTTWLRKGDSWINCSLWWPQSVSENYLDGTVINLSRGDSRLSEKRNGAKKSSSQVNRVCLRRRFSSSIGEKNKPTKWSILEDQKT